MSDLRRADATLPASFHWAAPEAGEESIGDVAWWRLFEDTQLAALIDDALRDSVDLRLAAAQVLEAQALVTVARAPLFPQVSGQAGATRGNDNPAFSTADSFAATLLLSWELDFWGRYRHATEAARAQLLATQEGRHGVVVSLVAGVARQYFVLNGLRQRLAVVQRTLATQRQSLERVELLARYGVQSAAEVRQAQTQLLGTANQIPALERQAAQAEHALATLLGQPPHSFDIDAELPQRALPLQVPPGLPSQLLERRPDIRQAEQQLRAANANASVARAQFFPAISLTGALGRASAVLGGLVNGRGDTTHAGGVALGVPIFQGGALRGNYDAAVARAEQAAQQYRRTILVALREVSDALAAYDRDSAEARGNRERVEVSAEYLRLANLRFRSGVISYLEVLDAQRQLLAAQLDLNSSEVNQRLAAVELYRALGGGWSASGSSPVPGH